MIENIQIKLSAIWIALMLVYLLGDVLRIFVGDFVSGEIEGVAITQAMALGIAVLMLIPILMLLATLLMNNQPVNRWLNIIAAGSLFVFNLFGLPTYPGLYDKFLIVVGLGFNLLTIFYAWNWA